MTEIQIIRTPAGEELVLLTRADYEALLAAKADLERQVAEYDALEDEALARIAEAAKAEAERDGYVPGWLVLGRIRGLTPLQAARENAGLRQAELAAAAGVSQAEYSEIESGAKAGTDDVLARLAARLGVEVRRLRP